jgi:DNA-binding transcriptional regulator YiaG
MTYSEGLKILRKKMLVTQTELAEILSVSFASVNRWEKV